MLRELPQKKKGVLLSQVAPLTMKKKFSLPPFN